MLTPRHDALDLSPARRYCAIAPACCRMDNADGAPTTSTEQSWPCTSAAPHQIVSPFPSAMVSFCLRAQQSNHEAVRITHKSNYIVHTGVGSEQLGIGSIPIRTRLARYPHPPAAATQADGCADGHSARSTLFAANMYCNPYVLELGVDNNTPQRSMVYSPMIQR